MARKAFQRLSDNGFDNLDVTESAVNEQNSIFAFKANGMHFFHLKKHFVIRQTSSLLQKLLQALQLPAAELGARVECQEGPNGC